MSRNWLVLTIAVVAVGSLAVGGCSRSRSETAIAPQPLQPSESRISRVTSKDGTLIAVECAGSGPTLIIVHGGIGDRTRWTPMFPLLSPHFTVCAMDRRGHGLSGDSPDYTLQKEAEDVASVVDSRPGKVFVLGHSYGGVSALEATFLTNRISKLILYEPPVLEPVERDLAVAGKMERMIREGAREDAAIVFLTEVVQLAPAEVATMKARPAWAQLVSTIDAQLRQMYALATYRFDAQRMRTVGQPTLLLLGGETTSPYVKQSVDSLLEALPSAKRVLLTGQQHNAMDTGRDTLASAVMAFLLDTAGRDVALDLTGTWATGSTGEPAVSRIVIRSECNHTPAHWALQQSGDTVRLWMIPESWAQGIANTRPVSTTTAAQGRVSGVDATMVAAGARYVLRYDSTSGHLRGTLNGAPFWAVRQDIVRPEQCIPVP